ncbi:acetyl-CoA carboxylase, carboxyl transferase, beta subunit [Desulfofarcimen acetoxidans DSM 771]|uniref:Acetyl-coenzyme A carboxylase carboxyl transferase subunit beta n=1 Tax=Desulfofarcimen acetoxidans (strain ATCC 49208 / DSM 771 / KCTC 5769 / VKM B-1644 / 5575) TaxID=485916 RepID=C8W256_DESAS|nr:acetyl-CoA carboxylase, carboxyltransferase subunit beta [Desulfofarcimen acetoxidans]ACV61720.1 acetyl-CoA carboxylase, carboxyl transferase, beta subunit [Desulfofarcimen acetoxidans DSM 771]
MVLDIFRKQKYVTLHPETKREIPEGLWVKCDRCGEILYNKELDKNFKVCEKCGFHFRLSSRERLQMTIDENSFNEFDSELISVNPLGIADYSEKLVVAREKTELNEAIVTGEGAIEGQRVVLAIMDARFIMGSMGAVVGEKFTRAVETAIEKGLPFLAFTASGGARMQEGLLSLMQMAKTTAALAKLDLSGGLYISVMTDPTTGGVSASFASAADIIVAEPGALIGFAGPRVIEQTIRQKLPEGFQRAEFVRQHGFVDKIVSRQQMKSFLAKLLRLHRQEEK